MEPLPWTMLSLTAYRLHDGGGPLVAHHPRRAFVDGLTTSPFCALVSAGTRLRLAHPRRGTYAAVLAQRTVRLAGERVVGPLRARQRLERPWECPAHVPLRAHHPRVSRRRTILAEGACTGKALRLVAAWGTEKPLKTGLRRGVVSPPRHGRLEGGRSFVAVQAGGTDARLSGGQHRVVRQIRVVMMSGRLHEDLGKEERMWSMRKEWITVTTVGFYTVYTWYCALLLYYHAHT